MTSNMLAQFYQRFETFRERKSGEDWVEVDVIASPIECFSRFGYQLLGMCYQMMVVLRNASLVPSDFGEVLALGTGQFFLGVLYLSYFLYKKALKEVPFLALFYVSENYQVECNAIQRSVILGLTSSVFSLRLTGHQTQLLPSSLISAFSISISTSNHSSPPSPTCTSLGSPLC